MEGVPEKSGLDEIEWNGGVLCPAGRGLARIIHERFYYNRGFAAATSLHAAAAACRRAGSPLSRSTYRRGYASLPRGSTRPSRYATPRFRDEPS